MFKSYGKFWKNFVNFEGKTSRSDYWQAFLMNIIIFFLSLIVIAVPAYDVATSNLGYQGFAAHNRLIIYKGSNPKIIFLNSLCYILLIFLIILIIPSISIAVRRLRDAGYHWAFIFVGLIPTVGKIVMVVLLCMPTSEDGKNIFTKSKRTNPDDLEKWHKLKKDGVITDEEYEDKKKDLL